MPAGQVAQTAQRRAQHPAQPPLVSVKTIDLRTERSRNTGPWKTCDV